MIRNLAFLLTLSLRLIAQVDHGSLNGAVTDASQAAVPGAKVEVVSATTGLRRETTTGNAGTYQLATLPIGVYTVVVSKAGFHAAEYKDVELTVGQARTLDVHLAVGAVSETVEVTAAGEDMNRTSAEVGGLIGSEQIKEIPVSGRNWASLMLLVPGAVNYSDGSQRNIRFNGHSIDDANYTFDGVDNNGVQEQTQKAESRLNIALDSIAEFRVSTAVYTAESGAAGGAQVMVVSKSGSNQFHGGTLYALRNDALDARSPFDGPTLPSFTLHQFGANFGGPIKKDKAFFFANYEGLRQDLGVTFISYVPNAAYRSQVLAKSPVLKPLLDSWPSGQTRLDNTTDQINLVASNHVREDSGMFRFDYRFNDKNTFYARYNTDDVYIDNPGDALGSHNVVPHVPTNSVLAYQRIFSPTITNELKFGVNRADYHNWGYGIAPVGVSVSSVSFSGLTNTTLDTEVGTTSVLRAGQWRLGKSRPQHRLRTWRIRDRFLGSEAIPGDRTAKTQFPRGRVQSTESSRVQDTGRERGLGIRQRLEPYDQTIGKLRTNHRRSEYRRNRNRRAAPHRIHVSCRILTGTKHCFLVA